MSDEPPTIGPRASFVPKKEPPIAPLRQYEMYATDRAFTPGEADQHGAKLLDPDQVLARLGLTRNAVVGTGKNQIPDLHAAVHIQGAGRYGQGLFFYWDEQTQTQMRCRYSASSAVAHHDIIPIGYGDNLHPQWELDAESFFKGVVLHRTFQWPVLANNGIRGWANAKWHIQRPICTAFDYRTYILYDSLPKDDTEHNRERRALQEQAERLRAQLAIAQGRVPYIIHLPPPPPITGRQEWGIDDYAAFYGDEAVRKLVDLAEPYQEPPAEYYDLQTYVCQLPEDFLTVPEPEIQSIIPGFVPKRSCVFFGGSHTWKTTFELFVDAHIALGRPIPPVNIGAREPSLVLYISGEDEWDDIQRTYHRLLRSGCLPLTPDQAKLLRHNFKFIDATRIPGVPRLVRRGREGIQPGHLIHVVERAINLHPDTAKVTLDTMSTLGLLEGEGAMQDAPAMYHSQMHRLCGEYSVGVMALHHVSKDISRLRKVDADGARGGSAIVANARATWQIIQDHGDPQSEDIEYPAPNPITLEERARQVPGVNIARLHVHKMRWDGPGSDSPYWIRTEGWKYELHGYLGREQAAIARVETQQATLARREQQESDAFLAAFAARCAELQRDYLTKDDIQALVVRAPGQDKPLGRRPKEDVIRRLISSHHISETTVKAQGNPKHYRLTHREPKF